MSTYTKRERIEAICRGEPADRPPVVLYHHFIQEETDPDRFVEATVAFQKAYDWDIVKINPRAVYLSETWGNEYDYNHYIGLGPKCVKNIIETSEDLEKIVVKDVKTAPQLQEQLDIVRSLREKLGPDVPIIETVFSPIALMLNLTGTRMLGRYREAPRTESPLVKLIEENPTMLHRALSAMAETLGNYAKELIAAGADGIFYSPLGIAREGYLTPEERIAFLKQYDLRILEEIKDAFTIFHTCGISAHPEFFADYPIKVLHWAESAPGNPSLADSIEWIGDKAIMGGVDERLFGTGSEKKIAELAAQAVKLHKGRPFVLAPECSVDPSTHHEEYLAMRNAVE